MSTDAIRRANDRLSAIMDAEMPRPPGKEDWAYRDLPKMREDFFLQLIEIVGEENLWWITKASYEHDGETYRRGQVFVSPTGLARVQAHIASKEP